MDAGDATPFGAWASVRGYFTPATLFLVLNLVIGTIALTSRSHQQRRRREHHDDAAHHNHHQQLDPHQQQQYDYYQQPQYATPPPAPAPLARTSSVLDRLRSIGLYRFRSGDFPPEYGAGAGAAPYAANHDAFAPVEEEETVDQAPHARSRSEPAPARVENRALPRAKKASTQVRKAQVARPPASRVVEAVAEDEAVVDARAEYFAAGSRRLAEPASPPRAEHLRYQEEYVPPPAPVRAPPPLSRTSSVLDRLRSLGLYSFLGAEQPAAASTDAFTSPAEDKKPAHAHYDRSRSEPARAREQGKRDEKKQAAEPKMAKSSSAARKAAAGPKLVDDDCVDARAEAFIDSFRREQSQKQVHHHDDEEDEHVVVPPPAPLARTSSVLDRLRSFSLYLRSVDPVPEDPVKAPAAGEKVKQEQYGRTRSEPAREQGAKKKQGAAAAAKMSKTSSERAAPAEECVDARADDFINKFRQQLQLQRLNSLLGGAKQ